MCGLTGFLGGTIDMAKDKGLLRRMADTLHHRGPDDAGYWHEQEQCIGLGHRRLAIVDLSPAGHQPMISTSGRYVIVFNGEIYNYPVLRKDLEEACLDSVGSVPTWRGHSDTETLLAAIERWGLDVTLCKLIGMFAFALWDKSTQVLTLGRDRIGEKPIYYGWQGQGNQAVFLFGSELKALRAHPAFENIVDRASLCLQLRHNAIPAPYSIYQGISKLPPGCVLTVSLRQREPNIRPYWSGAKVAKVGVAAGFAGSAAQAVDELESLLKDAVRQQMMADVPLGAFLSGGVDSSTVVAMMQAQSARPVKTFTIGFDEASYNEAEYAKAVARHLGTDHTELYVSPQQAMSVIPRLPTLYDEPFSDSSQIPTFLVAQLAKQHVTVSLSGDAGDELFCGYNRYKMTANLWRKLAAIPLPVRRYVANGISRVSPQAWNSLGRWLPHSLRLSHFGEKLHKGANVLASESADALYLGLISHWQDPASLVLGGSEAVTMLRGNTPELMNLDEVQRMMALDMLTYLPDDILVKVDRAAMGVSLETRVPFLDHRVVEFAWSLPQSMKLHDGQSKWVLRQVLYRHVPRELIERPKMGFGVPIGDWLRGPLREWAEALLDTVRLRKEGFFNPAPIREKWEEHLAGQHNWQYLLWDVLMFQAWLDNQ